MKNHNNVSKSKMGRWKLNKAFNMVAYCEALTCDLDIPSSLNKAVTGALRARAYDKLKDIVATHGDPLSHVDPHTYLSYATYFGAFKKVPLPGSDTLSPALEKYFWAEEKCKETNVAMNKLWTSYPSGKILAKAQDIIAGIVGMPDLDRIFECCRHGPGVSVDLPGQATTPFFKWRLGDYGVSDRAHSYLVAALSQETRAIGRVVSGYNESKLAFVPKTMWTDRSINIEPRGNTFLQLGIGEVLAERFNAYTGLSIRDQEHNRIMAKVGSLTGNYATIDLSSASDTISSELVRFLFMKTPGTLNWYRLLDDCRSHDVTMGTSLSIRVQKFASMGNGFIFPLQCIIYYALVCSTLDTLGIPGVVGVYGDDIIVPTEAYVPVTETLETFGFCVNQDKSFHEGPFRESCGADYWDGINVRPPITRSIPTKAWDAFVMLNQLQHAPCYAPSAWSYVHGLLTEESRIYGPADPEVMDKWIHLSMQDLYVGGHLLHKSKVSKRFHCPSHHALKRSPVDFSDRHDDPVSQYLKLELKLSEMGKVATREFSINKRRHVRASLGVVPLRIGNPHINGYRPD